MQADPSRLHRARGLFVTDDSTDILLTSLEGLGAELSSRWMSIGTSKDLGPAMQKYVARVQALFGAIDYASARLTEVLSRHQLIAWMEGALAYQTNPDVFAQVSDPKATSWRLFMGLAIKDFHVDIASLMDALAPVVIQAEGKLRPNDNDRLPGWADIQKSSNSGYRQQLPGDLCSIVDSTDRWWPAVKEIRHLLIHRKSNRIIFGNYEDGLLFQVYDQSRRPTIVLPNVLYRPGHYVVDFDLYSAFVLAEIVTLLDDLGKAIAPMVQISESRIAQMCLRLVPKSLAQSIERLIQVTG